MRFGDIILVGNALQIIKEVKATGQMGATMDILYVECIKMGLCQLL
jgi:hypothetical protein